MLKMWICIQDPSSVIDIFEARGEGRQSFGKAQGQVAWFIRDDRMEANAGILHWKEATVDSPAQLILERPTASGIFFEVPMGAPVEVGGSVLKWGLFPTQYLQSEVKRLFQSPAAWWMTQSKKGGELSRWLPKAAHSTLSVFLNGPSGSGKEILAKALHILGPRVSGPFVAVNCGAISEGVSESELFGHVKGSFTSAIRDRKGALLIANRGTLFLDEVADLSLALQVKLLRFLETGDVRPVGSDIVFHSEVRVVCATHKNLEILVAEKKFREDLYYRLVGLRLTVPSLQDRPEDIELLSKYYVNALGATLAQEGLNRLKAHSWGGNVRELKNVLERASFVSPSQNAVLSADEINWAFEHGKPAAETGAENLQEVEKLVEGERFLLRRALEKTKGNRKEAAIVLGIARSTLFEMLKRHPEMVEG